MSERPKLSIRYPQVGSRIRHKKFGYGDVVRIKGDVAHVRFHRDNKTRPLGVRFVEEGIFEVL